MSKKKIVMYITKKTSFGESNCSEYYISGNQSETGSPHLLIQIKGASELPYPEGASYPHLVSAFKRFLRSGHLKLEEKGGSVDYKLQFNKESFVSGKIAFMGEKGFQMTSSFTVPMNDKEIYYFRKLIAEAIVFF